MQINIETVNFDVKAVSSLSLQKLRQYQHKQLMQLWGDSVRKFISTVSELIAVDSGMSVASLLPLASKVRFKNAIAESLRGKGPNFKRRPYRASGQFGGGGYKSRAHGERLGQKAYDLVFGTPNNPQFVFNFKIVVLQYFLHENGLARGNSYNYRSLEKGRVAFLSYWESNFDNYVDGDLIAKFFLTGKI